MVVTGLASLVLVYSMFYMEGDTMYRRYFGFMCFFCFAMLGAGFWAEAAMARKRTMKIDFIGKRLSHIPVTFPTIAAMSLGERLE